MWPRYRGFCAELASHIKKQLMASKCARADVAERRRLWIDRRQPRMRRQPGRLVFIDETAVTTKTTRLRGRARRGVRLKAQAPFGKWGTQTFIAGLRSDRLTAPFVIEGAIDRHAFNAYVEAIGFKSGEYCGRNKSHGTGRGRHPRPWCTRWLSQSSKRICAGSPHEASMTSLRPSVTSAACSIPMNAGTSSRPQVMRQIKSTML
jgi:hypothetical protein